MSWMFIEAVAPCRACGRRRPVDGIANEVPCFCGAPPRDIGSRWARALELSAKLGRLLSQPQDFDVTDQLMGVWGPAAPTCAGCGAELLGMETPPPDGPSLTCSACGCANRLVPAPAFAEAPSMIQLLPPQPEGTALTVSSNGDTFGCPDCGGALEIDAAARTQPCSYCGASVYLPDPLWMRLQDTILPTRWYIWRGEVGAGDFFL